LFTGKYQTAVEKYTAHVGENIYPGLSWVEMINMDFSFFKNNGFDKTL
jgi:hypothetical protein